MEEEKSRQSISLLHNNKTRILRCGTEFWPTDSDVYELLGTLQRQIRTLRHKNRNLFLEPDIFNNNIIFLNGGLLRRFFQQGTFPAFPFFTALSALFHSTINLSLLLFQWITTKPT